MNTNQRYLTFSQSLINHFGEKVYKISLDAGMTCPNRDGTLSKKGCIFCHDGSHYKPKSFRKQSLTMQLTKGIEEIKVKMDVNKFIAFFQAYSGTYAEVDKLDHLYKEVLAVEDIVGLSIATRPDCLSDDILDLLQKYSKKTYLWLEIGMQSMHEKTLTMMNRGHDFACFRDAVSRAKKRGINVCAHAILHLPDETKTEMIETARILAQLGVEGIKLHHLHILKNTPLQELYTSKKIILPTMMQYVNTVCDFLEEVPYNTVIHRVVGDAPRPKLIAPDWTINKFAVINAINNEMKRRDSYQGVKYISSS